jgi:hypothetical protein
MIIDFGISTFTTPKGCQETELCHPFGIWESVPEILESFHPFGIIFAKLFTKSALALPTNHLFALDVEL